MRFQCIIFFLFLSLKGFSQPIGEFSSYSVKDGLSDNRTYSMIQDDRGFIWIATPNGLNFFDGNHFTSFNTNNSGLKSNLIYDIKRGQSNELVLATGNGAVIIDSRTAIMKYFQVPSPPELAVKANTIRYIAYTATDELLLGSDLGIYVMDRLGNVIDSVVADFKPEESRKRWLHFTSGIASFSNGDALISTTNGFYMYEYRERKITHINSLKNTRYGQMVSFLKNRGLSYIFAINRFNQLFFIDNLAAIDSIFIIDITQKKIVSQRLPFSTRDNIRWDSKIQFHGDSLVTITTASSGFFLFSFNHSLMDLRLISGKLADNFFITYVLRDRSKRFWIGTETGILKNTSNTPYIRNISITPFVPKGNYNPVCAVFSTDHRWWLAGYSKESGLMVLNETFQLIKRIDFEKPPLGKNFVVSITQWSKDTLLIGTRSGSWYVDINRYTVCPFFLAGSQSDLSHILIQSSFRDSKGMLWLSGGHVSGVWQIDQERGVARHFPPGNSSANLPLRKVVAFAEDDSGNIWMAHWLDGLTRWNRNKQLFDTLINNFPDKENVRFSCSGIAKANDEGLWIFLNSYGLVKYDLTANTFSRVLAINDAADDNAESLLLTEENTLWMNLRHSILVFDTKNNSYVSLTTRNGLPDEANSSEKIYYDSLQQIIAIGYTNTVALIDKKSVDNFPSNFKVSLTGVINLKDGTYKDFTGPIILNHRDNDILVKFAIADLDRFLPPTEIEYRLSKKDNWKSTGSSRSLNLNNLPPNSYHLQIRLAGENIIQPADMAQVELKILPPFYETIWFYISLSLLLYILGLGVYKIRKNQLHTLQKVRDNISSDLHDDIGSRLTYIRILSILGEEEDIPLTEKKKQLKKISEEALASGEALDEIVHDLHNHDEELDDITARMRRYAGELFDNNHPDCYMNASDEAAFKNMPAEKRRDLFLAFKEILNNIKKHAEASEVHIDLNVKNKNIFLEVKDNGRGFNTNGFTDRNGLKNINTRIKKWNGDVQVISEKDKGTCIIVTLPIPKKSHIKRIFGRRD